MNKLVALVLVAFGGLWGVACSSASGTEVYCDSPGAQGSPCSSWNSSAMSADTCTKGGGTPVASCPTANRLGTCTVEPNGVAIATIFYAISGFTAMDAQSTCAGDGGTWSPG
jgi:hypothetical protein